MSISHFHPGQLVELHNRPLYYTLTEDDARSFVIKSEMLGVYIRPSDGGSAAVLFDGELVWVPEYALVRATKKKE